jgi:hypothetical protein
MTACCSANQTKSRFLTRVAIQGRKVKVVDRPSHTTAGASDASKKKEHIVLVKTYNGGACRHGDLTASETNEDKGRLD